MFAHIQLKYSSASTSVSGSSDMRKCLNSSKTFLFSSVISFCNSVSSATGIAEVGDASDTMLKEMERMKINMPKILSDTVYICENQNEEITEINEVEGEVEQIVPVAGEAG